MRSRTYLTAFGALAAIALAACMPAPKLGAPQDSFTAATFKVKIADEEEAVAGAAVTARFFTAESVRPQLGRAFIGPESGAAVVMLNHRYWKDRFQSSPAAIGMTIVVDGRTRTIVGITPEAFQPEGAGLIWIPKDR
jgi:putative ABC transport system permease protein